MKTIHYVSIAAAISLIVFLYFAGNTIPPPPTKTAAEAGRPPMMGPSVAAITTQAVLENALANLPQDSVTSWESLAEQVSKIGDSAKMIPEFKKMAQFWNHQKVSGLNAFFIGLAAKLDNSEKNLTFAARLFSELMLDDENQASRKWEAENSIYFGEKAIALDSAVEDNKLIVATGYIEGAGEPMKGVQMLLGIVNQKPDDLPANLLLGKMSVESGQMDKALSRLEVVLKLDSVNKEALYYMAEACKGKGENKRAIELLEKCKRLVHDPGFSAKADEEINALK